MRAPGDHVEDLGMPLDDRRQRLDHRLEPLARPRSARTSRAGSGSSSRSYGRPAPVGSPRARLTARSLARRREHRRRAVRHDPHLARGHVPPSTSRPPRRVGHHDHELGLAADGREHLGLMRRRLRQHRVQRHDERLRQLLGERQRRTRRRGRRRSRTRAGAGRRRRRAGRASGPRGRSRRGPPARSSPRAPAAAGATAR